jgi:hypothetical protein
MNAWRVRHLYDNDEALQECALIFVKCRNKYAQAYGGRIDNPKWFMSMFKLWVRCDFDTFALRDRRVRDAQSNYEGTHRQQEDIEQGEAFLFASLVSASEELKQVLVIITKAPSEFLALLLAESDDISWSRRLSRLSGIKNVNLNIVGELRALLTGA